MVQSGRAHVWWRDRVPYGETIYLQSLQRRGSHLASKPNQQLPKAATSLRPRAFLRRPKETLGRCPKTQVDSSRGHTDSRRNSLPIYSLQSDMSHQRLPDRQGRSDLNALQGRSELLNKCSNIPRRDSTRENLPSPARSLRVSSEKS
jgi:hypothetical protein